MGFIVDSKDQYILNTNDIIKVYCLQDDGYYYCGSNKWILWADCCSGGRFQLDVKESEQEIRDSFWNYYKFLKDSK